MEIILMCLLGVVIVVSMLPRVGIFDGFWPAIWSRLIVGKRGNKTQSFGLLFSLIILLYILQWLVLMLQ